MHAGVTDREVDGDANAVCSSDGGAVKPTGATTSKPWSKPIIGLATDGADEIDEMTEP